MTHYTAHSVVIQDTADSSSTVVGSLTQVSTPIDNDVQSNATAGRFYPEQISVAGQKPRFTFSTYDLPKIIDGLGLTGRRVVEGVSKPGVALYQAKYTDSSLASGSAHRRLRFALSYNMIRRISVSHRQDAMAEAESVAIWDGTNDPLIIQESQALPTLPASSGRWTLAGISVGGVDLPCNIQFDIDFGISIDPFGCNSDIWDTHLNINEIKPVISITSLDAATFAASAVELDGLVGTHANTTFYLRKRLARQPGFVADITTEHISITASGILLANDAFNSQTNQRGQQQYQMHCDYDGTNAPLVFDTTAAIA